MINFRFHIVSLTAVLLALGVGLVLGTAFLDDALISTLRTQLDGLEGDLEQERERGADQRVTISQLEGEHDALDVELGDHVLSGSMAEEPVLLITRDGVDDELVDRAMAAFSQADADVVGVWEFQSGLALAEEGDVEQLSEALDVQTSDSDRLLDNVTGQLSDILYGATDAEQTAEGDIQSLSSQELGGAGDEQAAGPQGQENGSAQGPDATGGEDLTEPHEPLLLESLNDAGLVNYRMPDGSDSDTVILPTEGLRVVVIDGFETDLPISLLYTVLERLATEGPVPVVVSGPSPVDREDTGDEEEPEALSPLVQAVREEDLNERISTVDNLDRASGQVAGVLAAQAAQPGGPDIGHYGRGDGADLLLPPTDALPERG